LKGVLAQKRKGQETQGTKDGGNFDRQRGGRISKKRREQSTIGNKKNRKGAGNKRLMEKKMLQGGGALRGAIAGRSRDRVSSLEIEGKILEGNLKRWRLEFLKLAGGKAAHE